MSREHWVEIIPHRPDVLLNCFEIFEGHLVTHERIDGITAIRVRSWDGSTDYSLDFEEDVYSVGIDSNPEFNTRKLRFVYTSMTTPYSVYELDMETCDRKILKCYEVPGYNRDEYKTERRWAAASDGVLIPVSLVYRKDLNIGGPSPLLMYGYGSYGASTDPRMDSSIISLLDRGFIYAIAHIRGGMKMGRAWYDNGKLLLKTNTFTDFIACAEHVIEAGLTDPGMLFATGDSAGGLLMGAVSNMRPDLFKGIVTEVPFVDVVTTMLDDTLPLTTAEYDEWGNPNDPDYYRYMLTYSPFENVGSKNYPAMLVTTSLHDSQVQYWEPAKWVARLRRDKTDDNLLLLKTDMGCGHGGKSGRFRSREDTAFKFVFLLELVNLEIKDGGSSS